MGALAETRWRMKRSQGMPAWVDFGPDIAEGKREAMVNPDQRGRFVGPPFDQPFGDAASRPLFAGLWGGRTLDGRRITLRQINAQAFQAPMRRNSRCRCIGQGGHASQRPLR
jgi:hypothetical protein